MNHKTTHRIGLLSLLLLFAFPAGLFAQGLDAPPERMTYQGFLLDDNGVALGLAAPQNYEVIFRIHNEQLGGTNLWSEQQTITVDKGYFSVLLGEGTAVPGEGKPGLASVFSGPDAASRYIGITVKNIGAGGANLDIVPRLKLVSSPFSFLASHSKTTDVAARAVEADNATQALNADHAATADSATQALNADHAGTAGRATSAASADVALAVPNNLHVNGRPVVTAPQQVVMVHGGLGGNVQAHNGPGYSASRYQWDLGFQTINFVVVDFGNTFSAQPTIVGQEGEEGSHFWTPYPLYNPQAQATNNRLYFVVPASNSQFRFVAYGYPQ